MINSHRRRLMMVYGEDEVIDLSMVDNAGNPRSSMTTANCYLVHKAGTYIIPLVYGNAIKNSAVNTVAFYPNTSDELQRFLNHANEYITGPWITKSTSGTGVNKGMGLTAASAELLWQDRAGLITSVSVNGDYLEFTVGSFDGGNALIAVKDGSGIILWSWHIWATEDDLSNTTIVATGSHNYTVAPVNLGWVPTSDDGKRGYCTYYQWGRKDPFIPAATYDSNTNHTVYNINGAKVTGLTFVTIGELAYSIKNPTSYCCNYVNDAPIEFSSYNIWDAQNTVIDNVATATKKTIYDPCPPGFCVPTDNLWYYFANGSSRIDSDWDRTNYGKTWTLNGASIYFPAAGYRNYNSGSLTYVGFGGYCWSATPSNNNGCHGLNFNGSNWKWGNSRRAYGNCVRPVAEE